MSYMGRKSGTQLFSNFIFALESVCVSADNLSKINNFHYNKVPFCCYSVEVVFIMVMILININLLSLPFKFIVI